MNEELLIKRCQEGSRKDLEELIRRYYYPLIRFFLKYHLTTQTCEDLTHDTILKMIENIERYKNIKDSKFSTWLFTIAHNLLMNHLNRFSNKYESMNLEDLETTLCSNENTEEQVINNISNNAVTQIVNVLSIQDRTLINLRYQCDMEYREISKITGLKEKTVKWKLHDAIERLRKLFRKGEVKKNEL